MGLVPPSPKLQALLKDFQQIASLSGYLNHAFDPPQLRLFFTLHGRVMTASPEAARALAPRLQAWGDTVAVGLREASSSAILPPQVQVSGPLVLPDGRDYVVTTLTFSAKVTETSYLRVRTAVQAAYQAALKLRETGLSGRATDGPPGPVPEDTPLSGSEP